MKKRWENFLIKVKISISPILFGLIVSSLRWSWDKYVHIYILSEAGVISWIAGGLVTGLYITFATVALKQAIDKRSALMGAIRNKNRKGFMEHVDIEISPILRYLMANLALIVIGMFFTVEVPESNAAVPIAFIISYIFALVREIVTAYDNPLQSKKWPLPGVPDNWREKVFNREDCQ